MTIDKNPSIRTVINKTETLGEENEYRVLDYEVLAGEPNLHVDFTTNGLRYRFDYSKVFWNSKLNNEHERLVHKFKPGEAVCDVMAGVGPFAIPAGKKQVFVFANDLNPDCYTGLKKAIASNKKAQGFVQAFNEDGHDFIKSSARRLLDNEIVVRVPCESATRTTAASRKDRHKVPITMIKYPPTFAHYVMNLPGSAIDFLPDFCGICAGREDLFKPHTAAELPLIHCYCFAPKASRTPEQHGIEDGLSKRVLREVPRAEVWNDIYERISERLGVRISLEEEATEIWNVRDVSPNKCQYCVTFRLPAEVAFRKIDMNSDYGASMPV